MPSRSPRLACLGLALLVAQRPSAARACDDGEGGPFQLDEAWPADGATDVPTDGVLLFRALSLAGEYPVVAVDLAGVPVDGAVQYWSPGVSLWRATAPFAPDTTYHVAVTGAAGTTELTFTTGHEPAALPAEPILGEVSLEHYRLELRECADAQVTCDCGTWRTLDVEDRMRARVVLPAPPAPFGAFDFVAVELAPGPDQFPAEMVHTQPWPTDGLALELDLGLVGTWPSEQVCARAAAIDPVGHRVDGPPVCLPIADINTPPPSSPAAGCSITPAPAHPLALLFLLALRRRRRQRPRPDRRSR